MDLYHCLKPMLTIQVTRRGRGHGMDIIEKAEVVVVVAIILGIEVIIISLKQEQYLQQPEVE